jgi:hypothetical protein
METIEEGDSAIVIVDLRLEEPTAVPLDMRRFGALLCVHRFARSKGQNNNQLAEVIAAVTEFCSDEEICTRGLKGILQGSEQDLNRRYQIIKDVTGFSGTLQRIVLMFPVGDLLIAIMQVLTRILLAQPRDVEEYIQVAASTISTTMEVIVAWSSEDWGALLTALEASSATDFGRSALFRQDIVRRLEAEWEKIVQREDQVAKAIGRKYKKDTENMFALLVPE